MDTRHRSHLRLCFVLVLGLVAVLFSGCESTEPYGVGAGNFTTVVVDAGHGGHDRGAKAIKGAYEKDLTLDTAQRVARLLRAKGFRVIETRTGDYFVPLDGRVAIANREPGAIFVSIHYNWAKRRGPQGVEIYYYSQRSRRLAANILQETLRAYPTKNRGVKYNDYHVLRNNRKPAVLCELGFVSSPSDNSYVQTADYRQVLAERIVAGIIAERQNRNP